ncbi:hypothetical protein AB9P05_11765 [Roseivirga sp. BDSF3-8]|uniref:hypothetical protein n=1 Tax=Roseivirga sp. BDSF3-8 TaxID=3241598 RepID=UPI003531814E
MKTVIKHIFAASLCLFIVLSGTALHAKDTGNDMTGSEAEERVLTAEETEVYELLEEVVAEFGLEESKTILPNFRVKVYNSKSELIYEGSHQLADIPADPEVRKVLQKSDLMFESGNVKYYMLR